jgi:competence protein ComEC
MGTLVSRNASNQVILEISSVDGKKATGRVMATLPPDNTDDPLQAGTRLLVDGSLELPFSSPVPGTFNQQDYLRSQHITALLKRPNRLIAFETSNDSRFVLQRLTEQLKQQVATTFAKSLPSPQSEILGGIVLGDKAIPVDRATKQAFIQTGLIHVLAASGMNVGIIAGAVLWLLSLLKVPYRTRLGIAMGAVAFYSLLTGLPPSIQRAAAMLEIALFLKLLNRELSPVLLLCLASSLLVVVNPENIASVGFQFSVLTTFGLLTIVPPLQEAIGYYTTRWLAGLVLVPLVAQLWIWPLSVAYFNQFPIHSIPLNILAVALVVPLTIIGFTAGVISLIIPPMAGWLSLLAKPVLDLLLWLVNWGNNQSWAQWSLPSPTAWQIALLYICLFTSLLVIHCMKNWSKAQRALVGLLPVLLLLGGTCLANSFTQAQNRIDLLPISAQREALLIQPAHANTTLLIAPERPTYYEARTLADYLKHRHITKLSGVLLLPDPESLSDEKGSLEAAFPHTTIDLLLTNAPMTIPDKLAVHTHQVFPSQGGQIDLGGLKLRGQLSNLQLLHQHYCLLSLSQNIQTNTVSSGCGLQATIGENGKRFFSGANLSPNGFYHLVADRSELTVY